MTDDIITIHIRGGEDERDIVNGEFIQFAWDLKARLDEEWGKNRNWGWTLDSTRYFVEPRNAGGNEQAQGEDGGK